MARRVKGDREAAARFRELARYVAQPLNTASRRSLEPTLAAAKGNIVKDGSILTGRLLKSLTIKREKRSAKTNPRYLVGPDAKAKVRHAHLVEFGRAPNAKGKSGYRGTRFLTRAFEATKNQVPIIFGRVFGPALEARARKLNGKPE